MDVDEGCWLTTAASPNPNPNSNPDTFISATCFAEDNHLNSIESTPWSFVFLAGLAEETLRWHAGNKKTRSDLCNGSPASDSPSKSQKSGCLPPLFDVSIYNASITHAATPAIPNRAPSFAPPRTAAFVDELDGAVLVELGDLETLLVLLPDTEVRLPPVPLALAGTESVVVPPTTVVLMGDVPSDTVVVTGATEVLVVVSDGTIEVVIGSELPWDR